MEKFFSNHRILVYIIIALLFFNLATVGGIFWHLKRGTADFEHREKPFKGVHKKGDFIKEKLDMNETQARDFDKFHEAFMRKGSVLMDSMQLLRLQLLTEMTREKPDSIKLFDINRKLGNLHVELKKNMIDFYFNLKNICTKEQEDTLKNIFSKMLEFEGGGRRIHAGPHHQGIPGPPAPPGNGF